MNQQLLFFVDEGGFDDFTPLFVSLGFDVDFEDSQRKAVKLAKKNTYQVLVAEFIYNPEFRDRVSNIESLLATLEGHSPEVKIIILYDEINQPQLNQLKQRYRMDATLTFPVDEKTIQDCISN
ncbi:MAG TPA: hypothetical protein DCG46_02100 [Gammaproteobacteria bacterium]|jgi:hypothetical protein|uniref:Response regulatory domain-containing protein n=1 Tax=hydrothermal vent metagenome TaxID=652676 RepID=A0A1W1DQF0_9ZZZZ|nr:hypothetical protein [Candidatus Thioglobus sp.]HAD99460.1 hypothetical protein [Gammaproteobacteria bacterium]HAE04226.1 hypothetical protein [Gammaproteobacteria bacterium]HAE70377.1 hypothetical protein [Gammaproteobacteria bacterium]HAE72547.1 hypothetical protein [Gammaproteobacteria bacterium]HAG47621.1 hypothetical protein [Gammaproteobacteria bacterium]